MEVTEVKMRPVVGMLQFVTWTFGTMLFPGWAYFIREWRWLQTAVTLPCLLFLPTLGLMGESPRWLAVVGQHQRALKEVKRAALWNKVTLPPDQELLEIMARVQEKALSAKSKTEANSSKSTFWKVIDAVIVLFRTPRLRLVTVVMLVNYFLVSMLFFGLTLGASSLGVDPFIYVSISGTVELPSNTLLIPLIRRYGLKKMLLVNYALCALFLLAQPLMPQEPKWVMLIPVMLGKMAGSNAFSVLTLYDLELFPTEIRSQGMSASMMSSRVGAIIAPFIMSALDVTNPWAINVVFGAAAALSGLSVLPLWETINTRLPDTVEDLENRGKHKISAGGNMVVEGVESDWKEVDGDGKDEGML
ncbi:hypothetical protein Pmani_028577 [Petrolisthes manimaculis]|uniref:Major facilitator superfamily (MFS) profile domain-containing protein n=1 Tax=Petrolisthes manimaculis TaxID=1843537 RepID=A0AAE1TVJ5_9EUCA|nr:hypothetical protein Pmani_028577 [Petrolisthes manimaculis]